MSRTTPDALPLSDLSRASWRTTVRAYIALTKPNILWLLLITTVPAMVVADEGWPSTWRVVATLIGGMFAAGGAGAINQYADRDIDQRMRRTQHRPLPTGHVTPERALRFGLLLGALSAVWLTLTVNLISAILALAAIAFYVVIYTYYLKRQTVQNIVLGGAAGAMPPVIGWAAVTGDVTLVPVLLFFVVFYWTPPHFWALSLILEDDYREAGVPMLPVVHGVGATKHLILLYSMLLVTLTILIAGAADLGAFYLAVAAASGTWFIVLAIQLWREPGITRAMPLFKFSTYYLAAIFVAMAIDRLAA